MSSLHEIIAAVVAQHAMNSDNIVCQAASVAGASDANAKIRKPNSRYKRHGTLCKPNKSTWWRTLKKGDELEFLHFTSLIARYRVAGRALHIVLVGHRVRVC